MVVIGIRTIIVEKAIYRWIDVLFLAVAVLLSASEVKEEYELRQRMDKARSR